jgi:hypothetical protein
MIGVGKRTSSATFNETSKFVHDGKGSTMGEDDLEGLKSELLRFVIEKCALLLWPGHVEKLFDETSVSGGSLLEESQVGLVLEAELWVVDHTCNTPEMSEKRRLIIER